MARHRIVSGTGDADLRFRGRQEYAGVLIDQDGVLDWNVAVYCMNESKRLAGCLRGIVRDLRGKRFVVTVIVNGSTDGSLAIATEAAGSLPGVEVYSIDAGDKANAINQFIHVLRRPSRYVAEVDAYVTISPGSFEAFEARLRGDPAVNIVSGVCTNGRSMKLMTERTVKGGLTHGQFHAFPSGFLDRMVARQIRLPLSVYYGDGLLGTLAAHDLDPQSTAWDDARVAGTRGATYEIPELSMRSLSDVKRQFRRKVKQMQGRMEAAAVGRVIRSGGFESLPATARDLVRSYVAEAGLPRVGRVDRVFQGLAMRAIERMTPVEASRLTPKLVRGAEGAS